MARKEIKRRQFIEWSTMMAGGALLTACLPKERKEAPKWPMEQEKILARIKELNFIPDSELRTTIFPRKLMWEEAQREIIEGSWNGDDQSDWMEHLDLIDEDLKMLSEAGFKGGRLVVVPFEVTKDGENYNWRQVETALELFEKNGLIADLCVGPVDFPYGPDGIRLPKMIEDKLKSEMAKKGLSEIHLSLKGDKNLPESSRLINEFAISYLEEITRLYGGDKRIDKIAVSNEWPDEKKIEGMNGARMTVDSGLMLLWIKRIMELTKKKIMVNTNIHPTDIRKIKVELGPLLDLMGEQGMLGIDSYPSRESVGQRMNYGQGIKVLKSEYPNTELVLTEFQAEPWDDATAGKAWAEILTGKRDVITDFFERDFPPTLETYIIKSGIREIGLWGSPLWPVAKRMGYDFPLRITETIAESIKKS